MIVMPAKTMLFDQRVRTLHDFGASPHNTIQFNAQGRLVLLAGFGNLAGKIDIFDRRTLRKVCTIDAPNTSHCEWSPDGRFLLTATLSPRLRVDNGVKIWHCSGPLMHVQASEELYQASWRPTPVEVVPQFGQHVPQAPPPSLSVKTLEAIQKPTPSKPAGAYRPPGARGLATPAIFKREDEGGAPRVPTNGTATPPRGYNRGSPAPPPGSAPNGQYGQNGYQNGNGGQGGRQRQVPGAAHNPSPGPDGERKNRKRNKKKEGGEGEKVDGPGLEVEVNGEEKEKENAGKKVNGAKVHVPEPEPALAVEVLSPTSPGLDSSLDPVAKKVRNLNKKVCQYVCLFFGWAVF
jgi:translation initiation factor 2A